MSGRDPAQMSDAELVAAAREALYATGDLSLWKRIKAEQDVRADELAGARR